MPRPGLEVFKVANNQTVQMRLDTEDIPELKIENGILHAFLPNGRKLILVPGPRWAQESSYTDLIRDLKSR
jgi:hypothetical protein